MTSSGTKFASKRANSRGIEIAHRALQPVKRNHAMRIENKGTAKRGSRLDNAAKREQRNASPRMSVDAERVNADRFTVQGKRVTGTRPVDEQTSPLNENERQPRLRRKDPGKRTLGFVKTTQTREHTRSVRVHVRIKRAQQLVNAQRDKRVVEAQNVTKSDAQIRVSITGSRIDRQHMRKERDRVAVNSGVRGAQCAKTENQGAKSNHDPTTRKARRRIEEMNDDANHCGEHPQ